MSAGAGGAGGRAARAGAGAIRRPVVDGGGAIRLPIVDRRPPKLLAVDMVTRTASPSLPGGLTYLNPAAVVAVTVDDTAPRSNSVSGYGGKIPTRYRVTLADNRRRRVWAMCYGNAASLYVIVGGRTAHVGTDGETLLEAARDARAAS